MRKMLFPVIFFLCVFLLSCASQTDYVFIPAPGNNFKPENPVDIGIGNITGTRDGAGTIILPDWLFAFLNGGLEEIEKIYKYNGRYAFIAKSEGVNFSALERWADNFSTAQDFFMLAANRIEKRMISSANMYPDDEYGKFFETLIKNAYNAEYPGAVKEDAYWIKTKTDYQNQNDEFGVITSPSEIYVFFVLITIDKIRMQGIISNMFTDTFDEVNPSGTQRNNINRLRQNFFEGF